MPEVIEASTWGHGDLHSPLLGSALVLGAELLGNWVKGHTRRHTCICAHQLMCHWPGRGEGQLWHIHSREVGEGTEDIEGSHQQGFLSKWNK